MASAVKVGLRVIGITAVAVVIIASIAIAMGYLYLGVKQPSEVAVGRPVVCDDTVINAYNEVVDTVVITDEDKAKKAAKIQSQVDELKKNANFAKDATCAFIAYTAAALANNGEAAKIQVDAIEDLADQTVYPSNKLLDLVSIASMKVRVGALLGETGTDVQKGSG